ncbi:MAG: TetR/AcrR family transcriptional regulator [Clostridiales bacterium]|jgi:AcrR family transcriptional regulator|nr:TetR/AcrR family transcriptional regulator [Clostridiales bacterium]
MRRANEQIIMRLLGSQYKLPLNGDVKKTKKVILIISTILFAQKGYAAVSVKDIADEIGFKAASLYAHFKSKEKLWVEVIEHAKRMYLLYLDLLDKALKKVSSFEELLDTLFAEPIKMRNEFTCFAFSLILCSQVEDERCAYINQEIFLKSTIDFFNKWFKISINNGFVKPFDYETTSIAMTYYSFYGVQLTTQKLMGREVPYDHSDVMTKYKRSILDNLRSLGLLT